MPRRLWAARPRRQVSATYHGSLTHLRVGARERYHKLSGDGLTRSSNVTKATGGGCTPGALAAVPRLCWRSVTGVLAEVPRVGRGRQPRRCAAVPPTAAAWPGCWSSPPGWAAGGRVGGGSVGGGRVEAGIAGEGMVGAGSIGTGRAGADTGRAGPAGPGRGAPLLAAGRADPLPATGRADPLPATGCADPLPAAGSGLAATAGLAAARAAALARRRRPYCHHRSLGIDMNSSATIATTVVTANTNTGVRAIDSHTIAAENSAAHR